ncbi:kinase-like domain-containing protein [Fusarium mundagurra]|uniref:Kinase-like domain-containing protein n=1 Tax=Fusarium mundagurra TaxID=1567541 RepID=A0A8H5Z1K9_9HYPO|nr:kinase-like domain-containing protein [Fusarium mundagurra]
MPRGSLKIKYPQENVNKRFPLEEIDDNSWVTGQVIISRHASEPDGPCWGDGEGAFFTVSEAPSPKPQTRPLSDSCPIVEMSNGRVTSVMGIFEVGHAFLTIHQNVGTPEHITLEWLAEKDLSFQVPEVYYHGVHGDRYYLVYSAMPSGRNLVHAWAENKDYATMLRWTNQIADACVELSKWSGSAITGVDGGLLVDQYLYKPTTEYASVHDPENIRETCQEIPLDCSELVFALDNVHPLAFTVNEQGLVGISSWRHAGFVPKDWVGTKVYSNSIFHSVDACRELWTEADFSNWGHLIKEAFRKRGFKDCWHDYAKWNSKKVDEGGRYADGAI